MRVGMDKSEIRNQKSEGMEKIRNPKVDAEVLKDNVRAHLILDFGLSSFLLISDF